ncbi:MAG: flagellin [Bryobacteraceae bacterium]
MQFSSASAFTVSVANATAGTSTVTAGSTGTNSALYRSSGQTSFVTVAGSTEDITFVDADGTSDVVSLAVGTTRAVALNQLNAELNDNGIFAVLNAAGTGIDLQSARTFTSASNGGGVTGLYAVNSSTSQTVTAPAAAATQTGKALQSLTALSAAVTSLSNVSGKVGTGLNKLQYAVQLAQSQISNFSAAESRIRDADIAQEAANLTKAQVLQQASMAAMAQANSAPQAILALLRG